MGAVLTLHRPEYRYTPQETRSLSAPVQGHGAKTAKAGFASDAKCVSLGVSHFYGKNHRGHFTRVNACGALRIGIQRQYIHFRHKSETHPSPWPDCVDCPFDL